MRRQVTGDSPMTEAAATTGAAPRYQSGFGNHFASEALPGALPEGRNSPQRCAYGLYAEQFSGTDFTAPRSANRRSWLYRIRPAAVHDAFRRTDDGRITSAFGEIAPSPNQLRWDPPPLPREPTDFIEALATAGAVPYFALQMQDAAHLRAYARIDHSPLDVVAWHGNHAPYRYDLRRFNTMGSVSYDHPDPSIFLVLQSVSDTPGVDAVDFVIFPPRWLAMQDTFRPPWFHRNVASEFMGLIEGVYDAKAEGFAPGGASLHNCMSGHGPDRATFERASAADTSQPRHVEGTMAFMFETRTVIRPTRYALETPLLQSDYQRAWRDLKKNFAPDAAAPRGRRGR